MRVFLLSICLWMMATPAFAAEIYFGAPGKTVGVNEPFPLGVFLNTQDESVNTIQATVTYPSTVGLKGIKTGESIISFWVDSPRAADDCVNGFCTVSFSGIVPGGFKGTNVQLLTLVLEPTTRNAITITTTGETVLKNDGKGTATTVQRSPITLTVGPSTGAPVSPPDTAPPETFTPQVTRDPNVENNAWILVFLAQDKDSGIDHYEVKEGNGAFKPAMSPYRLEDQKLQSAITVKAIDRNGNERTATLPPIHPQSAYPLFALSAILAVIVLIGFLIWRYVKRPKRS